MTLVLPPTNSLYDQTLDAYYIQDSEKSSAWIQFLESIGKPLNYNPQTDPVFTATSYSTLKGTIVWDAYLEQLGLPNYFDPDVPPNNPAEIGTYFWYQYLESINKPRDYNPELDPNLTPAQLAQFLADFDNFATAARAQFQADFLVFAAAYQAAALAAFEQRFVRFVNARLVAIQTQELNLASPDEAKKRIIMFETFETLLKMLLTLQDTIGVIGQNLIFYGKWQEVYTKMLTRVPIYVGDTSSKPNIDLVDLSKFTFGYNNISVEDIANWYADNAMKGTSGTFYIATEETPEIDIAGDPNLFTHTAIKIVEDPNGTSTIDLVFIVSGVTSANTPPDPIYEVSFFPNGPLIIPQPGATFNETVQIFEQAFKDFYNIQLFNNPFAPDITRWPYLRDVGGILRPYLPVPQNLVDADGNILYDITSSGGTQPELNFFPFFDKTTFESLIFDNTTRIVTGTMTVPWLHTFVAPESPSGDEKTRADIDAKARGELNARNQQYIENIRSRRQIVQNTAKQVESNLSQAKEAVSEQSNLLTNILESLKSLISSIFR